MNGVPNMIETLKPTVRRGFIPHLTPDPLLGVEPGLIRRQEPETKAPMCSYKKINLLPLMPSGSVYIQPDRRAAQLATKMLQASNKSFSVSVRPSDHTPSARKRSNPSKQIQPLAMLARRRNTQPSSPSCPSYPQTRVQRKSRFVLKDDGFLRAQTSEFFLTPDESAWPLRSCP